MFTRNDIFCAAVRHGDVELVSRMLSEQYDPNSDSDCDLRYMTALEGAVDELHIRIVALLYVQITPIRERNPTRQASMGTRRWMYDLVLRKPSRKANPLQGFQACMHYCVQIEVSPVASACAASCSSWKEARRNHGTTNCCGIYELALVLAQLLTSALAFGVHFYV